MGDSVHPPDFEVPLGNRRAALQMNVRERPGFLEPNRTGALVEGEPYGVPQRRLARDEDFVVDNELPL